MLATLVVIRTASRRRMPGIAPLVPPTSDRATACTRTEIHTPTGDRDAQTSILDGIEQGSRLSATILPGVIADSVATFGIFVFFIATEPTRVLAVGCVAVGLAFVSLLLARRVVRAEAFRHWDAYGPLVDGVAVTLGARLELIANGVDDTFRVARHAELDRYAQVSRQFT